MSQSLVLVAGESPQHLLQVVGLQECYQHFLCKKKKSVPGVVWQSYFYCSFCREDAIKSLTYEV